MELGLLHRQIDDPSLSRDERARLRCELAKRLEEAGDYNAAREALDELWPSFDERPQIGGLDGRMAAEVLLRVGTLVGWIGSTRQIAGAQERAKNLISESAGAFEALPDASKAAEAQIELAVCYWREGAFDEARVVLEDALSRLTDRDNELKGIALLRQVGVEKDATRYGFAFNILTESAPLFETISNHALKGKFHNEFGAVLTLLSEQERREDYIDRALVEYAAASFHFEQAGHDRYQSCVENNLGYLYSTLGRYAEAHEHLNHARRLLINLKDTTHVAQVDETRARAMLAEGRNADAERVARAAVETLEKGDHQHLLAEALTTHGTALARLDHRRRAQLTFQHAVLIAEQAGDREGAGSAILTAIDELTDQFAARELGQLYERASELLATSSHAATRARLNDCAGRVIRAISARLGQETATARAEQFKPHSGWHDFDFRKEMRRYEAFWIERALRETCGVVTRAAQLLGFKHHQSLTTLLTRRHRDLLHLRSPIEPRKRSAFRLGKSHNNAECRARKGDAAHHDPIRRRQPPCSWRGEGHAGV
jgi:tetratricopeptide (TPR) repeat protein